MYRGFNDRWKQRQTREIKDHVYKARDPTRHVRIDGMKNPGDFWIINSRGFKGAHFAVYPEELLQRPILSSSRIGDIVLDPFIGSGTTAVVAKKFGRRFLGCDINPEYVRIAGNRLQGVLNKS